MTQSLVHKLLRAGSAAALLLLIVTLAPCRADQQLRKLTLDEAIRVAKANNKSIAIARARLEKSRALVQEAKAAGNFQLQATADVRLNRPIVKFGDATIFPGTTKEASASLSKVIDAFGQVRLGVSIADLQRAAQELDLSRAEQQLALDVKEAYYNVLRAQAQRDVAEAAVRAAEEHLRVARAQFNAGTAPQFDVTRAEVQVANDNQNLISAANAVSLAKSFLNNTLGLDVNTPIELSPVPSSAERKAAETDISANIRKSHESRPEVLQSRILVKLSQQSVELSKRGSWPVLAASAQYGLNLNPGALSGKESVVAMLALKVPIWDGGLTRAQVQAARSDLSAAESQLEQVMLGVALEVRSAALSVTEAADRVSTAAENVRLAEEAVRLAGVRYEAGISTAVEVTDADVALKQARSNAVNATYDYLSALARLERAVGAPPELSSK